jgi:hypothetical protein
VPLDLEICVPFDLAYQCIEGFIFVEVYHLPTSVTYQVVMVVVSARQVGVATSAIRVAMYPLHHS